jgi:DNA-binding response OmpR family regulator
MKKILVIDDDKDILEALQLILEGEGYYVQTATKEFEALSQLSSFVPDLVILDVLLSGEDGRVVCEKIKNNTNYSHIPVLMMSAHLTAKDSSYNMGADSFLAKPFDIAELLQKINQF